MGIYLLAIAPNSPTSNHCCCSYVSMHATVASELAASSTIHDDITTESRKREREKKIPTGQKEPKKVVLVLRHVSSVQYGVLVGKKRRRKDYERRILFMDKRKKKKQELGARRRWG